MSIEINNLRVFGNFRLDVEKKVLWFENEPVNLQLKEIELLCVLTENSGGVVTKDELMSRVWAESFVEESNLSRHIYRIRKTFEELGESENLIQTVPRRGYRFTGQVSEPELDDLIIEKHSISRTLIEELENSAEPNVKIIPAQILPAKPNRFWIPVAVCLTLLMTAFGYYFFNSKSGKSVSNQPIKSLAVLPLKSYKTSKDNTLAIRITDAVITRLGTSDKIIIRPTNAVLPFSNEEQDATEIGRKLQTDTVLDGRIQQEENRLRITLQLINVADGKHLWSGQIDGFDTQILILQDEVALKILQNLDPDYQKETILTSTPTKNSDAYEAYLQGRYFASQRTGESLNKAVEYFQKSIELDPNFAESYAGLADTQYLLYDYNFIVTKAQVETARANLKKSLSLKPKLADALVTLGAMQMNYDWDWKNAEESYKKAIEISPNNSFARARYGALLTRLARFEEAQMQFGKSVELDPLSLPGNVNLGMIFFCKKDFVTANRQFYKGLEINPKYTSAHWFLSRSFWLQGKKDETIKEILTALEADGNQILAAKLKLSAQKSPETALRDLLFEWQDNPQSTNPHNMAYLSAILGEKETAIEWLEKSFAEHHPWTTWIKAAPEFETLRNEPRFQAIVKKMNL
jgi:DNA-binding winged helix-turn-helix (wHTH) protein/TolB-like protein/Tfp pilus assembly protein PilF